MFKIVIYFKEIDIFIQQGHINSSKASCDP